MDSSPKWAHNNHFLEPRDVLVGKIQANKILVVNISCGHELIKTYVITGTKENYCRCPLEYVTKFYKCNTEGNVKLVIYN